MVSGLSPVARPSGELQCMASGVTGVSTLRTSFVQVNRSTHRLGRHLGSHSTTWFGAKWRRGLHLASQGPHIGLEGTWDSTVQPGSGLSGVEAFHLASQGTHMGLEALWIPQTVQQGSEALANTIESSVRGSSGMTAVEDMTANLHLSRYSRTATLAFSATSK